MNCNCTKDYKTNNGSSAYLQKYLEAINGICNINDNYYGGDYYKNLTCCNENKDYLMEEYVDDYMEEFQF